MVWVVWHILRATAVAVKAKRLSTKLWEYILENYNNTGYVITFGRVDMKSLFLTQREMTETSQIFHQTGYTIELESW